MKKVKEVHNCCGRNKAIGMVGVLHIWSYPDYYKCQSKASLFENGKWFCKRHAPSKVKERKDKAEERMWEKYRLIREQIEKEKNEKEK